MKVSDSSQKLILFELFQTEQGPRQFTLDKLFDAASAAKKLALPVLDEEGNLTDTVRFTPDMVEFTPAEVTILKNLFDERKEWDIARADPVQGLRALFSGINLNGDAPEEDKAKE